VCAYVCVYERKHTHTHTHAHTRTHAHLHAHTHTHTQGLLISRDAPARFAKVVFCNVRQWVLTLDFSLSISNRLSLSRTSPAFFLALSLSRSLTLSLLVSSHRCTDGVFSVSGSPCLSPSFSLTHICISSLCQVHKQPHPQTTSPQTTRE